MKPPPIRPAAPAILACLITACIAAAACGGDGSRQERQAEQEHRAAAQSNGPADDQGPRDAAAAESAPSGDGEQAAEAEDRAEPIEEAGGETDDAENAADDEPRLTEWTVGGERPAALYAPADYDGEEPLPLIVLLHGYVSTATAVNLYFGSMHWFVDEARFALLLPQGRPGGNGLTFWDATPACCEFTEVDSDDVAYLTQIVEEARGLAAVDGVYVMGNSNGGFMAYRMACEGTIPDLRGIVSMAGSSFEDPSTCADATPLSVLQIHGTEDREVRYEGTDDVRRLQTDDEANDGHPGARELVQRWADRAGCLPDAAETGRRFDLVPDLAGAETALTRRRAGCTDGATIDLWSIEGGGHAPAFESLAAAVLAWVADVERHRRAAADAAASEPAEQRLGTRERPAPLLVPARSSRDEPLPLMLVLHGYGGDGAGAARYLGLLQRMDEDRFALLLPDGRIDQTGARFWDPRPDDSGDDAYLGGLVDEARGHLNVGGVYVAGYSNGGFMAYAMACSGRIPDLRAVASLAGSSFEDPARCADPSPISVLHIHGDEDGVISYSGYEGEAGRSALEAEGAKPETSDADDGYPGAEALARRWAAIAGCDLDRAEALERIDIDQALPGAETAPTRYREGCTGGATIELWTIEGGGHVPFFGEDIGERISAWLHGNRARTDE